MTITVSRPSFDTYSDLQSAYSTTLKCPCTTMIIPYRRFMTLSPTLHQICSSDFVSERWISVLKISLSSFYALDWRNQAFAHFQLLSNLCDMANRTIEDAVSRFLSQSFVTLDMLNQADLNIQLNTTLDQVFQSMSDYFDLLINTVDLIVQVDQPFTEAVLNSPLVAVFGVLTRNFEDLSQVNVDYKWRNASLLPV